MCGIVALVGSQAAAPLLLEGLRQLEYRGYDSAGIATVNAERYGSAASDTPAGPPMASRKNATRTRT